MKTLTSSSNGGECRDPSLGLATKERGHKSAGQKKSLGLWEGVRMNIHTPK